MENLTSTDQHFLALISKIIEENLGNEHFTVEDMARESGMSRSMLHRKLKKLTGKSAGDLITVSRLQKAWDLIECQTGTISEISYRVGFSDPSYFTKVFKSHFKILPGDVKKGAIPKKHRPDNFTMMPEVRKSGIQSPENIRIVLLILVITLVTVANVYILFGRNREKEKSIAVLPIKNYTGNPDNAYFIDGMQDALIGELSRIASLRVISRTSTMHFRESDELLKKIARDLGVTTIVEGSMIKVGDSLNLIIQIIDVYPKEKHLFYKQYQDDLQHVLHLQQSAARDIAKSLGIKLSDDEERQIFNPRLVNPETYKNYLRGMYYLNQGTPETFQKGISFMIKAIDSDPGDPLAYAGLAIGYAIQGHGMVVPEGSFRSAAAAAERALLIDPTLDEAYTALALIHSYQVWDWPKVKSDFEKALANNPNNAVAHHHFSFYYTLFNNSERAFYHANMALTLEPFSASYYSSLAAENYFFGKYEEAETYARKSLELQEDNPYGLLVLGWILVRNHQYEKALEIQSDLPVYADYYKMLISYTYIKAGQRETAEKFLTEMEAKAEKEFVNPVFRGMLAGMLGYNDRAFELFNEAADQKMFPVTYIKIYPGIEHLKNDPRYAELMKKMNLPV